MQPPKPAQQQARAQISTWGWRWQRKSYMKVAKNTRWLEGNTLWLAPCDLGIPGTDLFSLLVEDGRHVQQGAALVQGCCKCLPLLLQLICNLLNLLGGVVAWLHQATGHWHYAVYIYIHVLQRGGRGRGSLRECRQQTPPRKHRELCGQPANTSPVLRAQSPGAPCQTPYSQDSHKPWTGFQILFLKL